MRYELKHDKLADKIYERASDAARDQRRAEEVFNVYLDIISKRDLNEDDLNTLYRFKEIKEPDSILLEAMVNAQDRIDKEKRAALEQAEKEKEAALAQKEEERELREKAEYNEKKAKDNEKRAKDNEKRAKDNEKRAKDNLRIAIFFFIIAVIAGSSSFIQKNNALVALKEVARRDFTEIDELILHLDYQGAWSRLQTTAQLGVYADSIAMKMAEPAFFYAESGDQERAKGMLDTIAEFSNNRKMRQLLLSWPNRDSVSRRQWLRKSIIALDDSVTYKTLTARYYPEMVFVEGGAFTMEGCTEEEQGEKCPKDEFPLRQVTLDDYWIAKTETTIWQWALYMNFKGDLSSLKDKPGHFPVRVSWFDIIPYTNWLNMVFGYKKSYTKDTYLYNCNKDSYYSDDIGYHLTTNSEWEYAARGGRETQEYIYSGSNILDEVGWSTSQESPKAVKGKKANELGLFDMSGNIDEWCWNELRPNGNVLYNEDNCLFILRGGDTNHKYNTARKKLTFINFAKGKNNNGFRLSFKN